MKHDRLLMTFALLLTVFAAVPQPCGATASTTSDPMARMEALVVLLRQRVALKMPPGSSDSMRFDALVEALKGLKIALPPKGRLRPDLPDRDFARLLVEAKAGAGQSRTEAPDTSALVAATEALAYINKSRGVEAEAVPVAPVRQEKAVAAVQTQVRVAREEKRKEEGERLPRATARLASFLLQRARREVRLHGHDTAAVGPTLRRSLAILGADPGPDWKAPNEPEPLARSLEECLSPKALSELLVVAEAHGSLGRTVERQRVLQPGELVDRFRIVKQLGEGGMGEVYLAIDKQDYRNVALKVIKADTPDFANALERFRREVDLYRKIAHPNVVNFIATGAVGGLHFVALEHIIGLSLRQWLNRHGRTGLRRAFSWVQDLVLGLHAAHQHDVIHRDLKPENIMITKDESVKIIDFGLARAEARPTVEELTQSDRLFKRGRPRNGRLTGGSGVVGTLSYLAPECLQGQGADGRSDIFGLGLVAYEMLMGHILVQDVSSAAAMMERHKQIDAMTWFLPRPVEPLAKELEAFVLRMLRADPTHRFLSTEEMVSDLHGLKERFGKELDGSERASEKRMAEQELADTHYWQAMNLLAENEVVPAVEEFCKILTFAASLDEGSRDSLLRELDLLFSCLQLRAEESDVDPFHLEKDRFVEVMKKLIQLYRAFGDADDIRLKMRIFLRCLKRLLSPEALAACVQEVLPWHMGDVLLMREYFTTLEQISAAVAQDVWLKFVQELALQGRLADAWLEVGRYVATFGQDREIDRCSRDLAFLEKARTEEESGVLGLLEHMDDDTPVWRREALCEAFLQKHPSSLPVLTSLAAVYRGQSWDRKLAKVCSKIGVVRYWHEEYPEAESAFVEALELENREPTSINYLTELVEARGELGPVPHDRRALLLRLFETLDLFRLAIKELERDLLGTAQDATIYERIRDLALRSGHEAEAWKWDFEIANSRLRAGEVDGARTAFDEGLERAPDQRKALKVLRGVPMIHKVFSVADLARRGHRALHPAGGGGGS